MLPTSSNLHEGISRVGGGSDSERTQPSGVGIRQSSNTDAQINSSNLFNQSKSKIEDSSHQCVGEGLDERIDQENQLMSLAYEH